MHLNGPDGFSQKSGISGTHNLDEFMRSAAQNNVKIIGQTPTITPGIFNIEYQIPSLNSAGGVALDAGGSPIFKNPLFTKTVYDPAVFSTKSMLEFGQQAAASGYKSALTSGAKTYNSEAGGIPFRVYIDPKTGLITNFHPR
jgi:filamentous hemagglutinin